MLPKRTVRYKQERKQANEELRSRQATEEERQQKDQEQHTMTETMLKELESNRMEISHMTVKLETMTAERKQHTLELKTLRQKKYEAWMKRAEVLTNENKLWKR